MQFTPEFIDMDGGLTNPSLAIAVVVAAIIFGIWMMRILRSRRPPLKKGIRLALAYGVSLIGTQMCLMMARLLMTSSHPQGVQVGFIGDIPLLAGPTAALILGAILYGLSLLLD
jgi:hypothetical protein